MYGAVGGCVVAFTTVTGLDDDGRVCTLPVVTTDCTEVAGSGLSGIGTTCVSVDVVMGFVNILTNAISERDL
jgi:hypothetical protein